MGVWSLASGGGVHVKKRLTAAIWQEGDHSNTME